MDTCTLGVHQLQLGTCYFNAALNAILLSPRLYGRAQTVKEEYNQFLDYIHLKNADDHAQLEQLFQITNFCLNDDTIKIIIENFENGDEAAHQVARMSFARFLQDREDETISIGQTQLKTFIQQTTSVHRNIPIENMSKMTVSGGYVEYALKALLYTIYGKDYKQSIKFIHFSDKNMPPVCDINFNTDIVVVDKIFKQTSIQEVLQGMHNILKQLKRKFDISEGEVSNECKKQFDSILSETIVTLSEDDEQLFLDKVFALIKDDSVYKYVSDIRLLKNMGYRDIQRWSDMFIEQITINNFPEDFEEFKKNVKSEIDLRKELIDPWKDLDFEPSSNADMLNYVHKKCNANQLVLDHAGLLLTMETGPGHVVVGVQCNGKYMVIDSNHPTDPFIQDDNKNWSTGYTDDIVDHLKKYYETDGLLDEVHYSHLCYVRSSNHVMDILGLCRKLRLKECFNPIHYYRNVKVRREYDQFIHTKINPVYRPIIWTLFFAWRFPNATFTQNTIIPNDKHTQHKFSFQILPAHQFNDNQILLNLINSKILSRFNSEIWARNNVISFEDSFVTLYNPSRNVWDPVTISNAIVQNQNLFKTWKKGYVVISKFSHGFTLYDYIKGYYTKFSQNVIISCFSSFYDCLCILGVKYCFLHNNLHTGSVFYDTNSKSFRLMNDVYENQPSCFAMDLDGTNIRDEIERYGIQKLQQSSMYGTLFETEYSSYKSRKDGMSGILDLAVLCGNLLFDMERKRLFPTLLKVIQERFISFNAKTNSLMFVFSMMPNSLVKKTIHVYNNMMNELHKQKYNNELEKRFIDKFAEGLLYLRLYLLYITKEQLSFREYTRLNNLQKYKIDNKLRYLGDFAKLNEWWDFMKKEVFERYDLPYCTYLQLWKGKLDINDE